MHEAKGDLWWMCDAKGGTPQLGVCKEGMQSKGGSGGERPSWGYVRGVGKPRKGMGGTP